MFHIPLGIITIWHPDYFLKIPADKLIALPLLRKTRDDLEVQRTEIAKHHSLNSTIENLHGRPIINLGKPKYSFRKKWIYGRDICSVLSDYTIRIIDTEETGTQARFRAEARPNWGNEPNILPDALATTMINTLSMKKISIRQLWVNPFTIDTSKTNKSLFYEAGHSVNLVIGPYDPVECKKKKARLNFSKHGSLVPMHQHRPFYRGLQDSVELQLLDACSLWYVEYD